MTIKKPASSSKRDSTTIGGRRLSTPKQPSCHLDDLTEMQQKMLVAFVNKGAALQRAGACDLARALVITTHRPKANSPEPAAIRDLLAMGWIVQQSPHASRSETTLYTIPEGYADQVRQLQSA